MIMVGGLAFVMGIVLIYIVDEPKSFGGWLAQVKHGYDSYKKED